MLQLERSQKRSLALIIIATIFDGITQGILLLQESIARKALGAGDLDITLIGVIANGTMLLSFFIFLLYNGRNKRAVVAVAYLAGRLVFAASFLISKSSHFLLFLCLYHAAFAVQLPVMNGFYPRLFGKDRGRIFGIVRTVLILSTMLVSMAAGRLLDAHPESFRPMISFIALSALCTYAIVFFLESRTPYGQAPHRSASHIIASFKGIVARKKFMKFEAVFMTYGFAFMICVPAVPIYLLRVLKLSYSSMSLAQGVVAQSVILALTPFAGRLFDRINPWHISAFSNLALIFYPLFFLLSFFTGSSAPAFIGLMFYSLGLAGTNILWNLGSAAFAHGEDDAFLLQSFHISLTGLRGIAGPFLGLFILSVFGLSWNFAISALLFAIASLMAIDESGKAKKSVGLEPQGEINGKV